MDFSASAPSKAILFGEHYVVWGAPALSIAIEPRNRVGFTGGSRPGIGMQSALGNGLIAQDGSYSGVEALSVYSEVARAVFGSAMPSAGVRFSPSWNLKGVGVSASLCAAFAAGCFALAGKKPAAEEIFAAAQSGDLKAHGGKASGIDAKTVSFGRPLVFQRSFEPPAFNSSPAAFALPAGTSLMLIDTYAGKKGNTGELIAAFGRTFGITSTPQEAQAEKREKVQEEFAPLWKSLGMEMKKPDAKKLGLLMNENHALLNKRGVGSQGIEEAVAAALAAGAYGAKLTGAGGEGGAVLALIKERNETLFSSQLQSSAGFASFKISLAKKGAGVD